MIKKHKTTIISLLLSLLSLGIILYFYPKLPEQIATHFDINGKVDGHGNKSEIFILAAAPFLATIFLPIAALIDPRKDNFKKFTSTFKILQIVLVLVFIAIAQSALFYQLGYITNINQILLPTISIMLIIFGNYAPKIKHNYSIGFRTPWTLASKTSWEKSNRMAGYAFTIIGIISLVLSFVNIPLAFKVLFACLILSAILLTVYSYLIFKQEENEKQSKAH